MSIERSSVKTKTKALKGKKRAFQVERPEARLMRRYPQATAARVRIAGTRVGA
jgi:hypothetical protein